MTITRGTYGGFTIISGYDLDVYLQIDSINSTNHKDPGNWEVNPIVIYGSSSDYWFNTPPTPQQINDPFFSFVMSAESLCTDTSVGTCDGNCTAPDGNVFCWIVINTYEMTVYYSFPPPKTSHSDVALAASLGVLIPFFVITIIGIVIFFLWKRRAAYIRNILIAFFVD